MALVAPETPTVDELEALYPLDPTTEAQIAYAQDRASDILSGRLSGLFAVVGPCSMTTDSETINREGDALAQAQQTGLVIAHRMPPWKPRTRDEDWHGLETEPDTVVQAYATIAGRAAARANVAIEYGLADHLDRYAGRITFGWGGSRHDQHHNLVDAMAMRDPNVPIGFKNAMDGSLDSGLRNVQRTGELRGEQGAPAVLIYRGGLNAKNPADWEQNYREALERTDGRMIVDTAHGGEMAFDPEGNYQKSAIGQIACMNRVLQIASQYGEAPVGIMIEASDIPKSPTDPNMPFEIALGGVARLHQLRMSMPSAVR